MRRGILFSAAVISACGGKTIETTPGDDWGNGHESSSTSGGSTSRDGAGGAVTVPGSAAGSTSSGGNNAGGAAVAQGGAYGGSGASASAASSGPPNESGGAGSAKPELGLTDILPLFTPGSECDACVRLQCPHALTCSAETDCANSIACVVDECWASLTEEQNAGDAANCVEAKAECRRSGIEACTECGAGSRSALIGGLEATDCVYGVCLASCQY